MRSSDKDIVRQLSNKKVQPFVAPLTPTTQYVYIKQEGVPYRFGRDGIPNGWHRFSVFNNKIFPIVDNEPSEEDKENYRYYSRSLLMIAIYPLDSETMLCYPYSEADAEQKGYNIQPYPVYLVSGTVNSFDLVKVIGNPESLVFVDSLGDGSSGSLLAMLPKAIETQKISKEYGAVYNILRSRMMEIERQKEAKKIVDKQAMVRYQLEVMGAGLAGWEETNRDVIITWTDREGDRVYKYTSRISKEARVNQAGICLSGGDSKLNVAAMVDVFREARQLNRPGAMGTTREQVYDYNDRDDYEDDD